MGGRVDEVTIAVAPLDLAGVLAVGRLACPVGEQAGGVRDAELGREVGDDARRDGDRIGEERAQIPDGGELETVPEPVMVAAALRDQGAVVVVEIEGLVELQRGRLAREATVAALLLLRQEVNGHGGVSSAARTCASCNSA